VDRRVQVTESRRNRHLHAAPGRWLRVPERNLLDALCLMVIGAPDVNLLRDMRAPNAKAKRKER
jgi:hypothetical protein